MKLVISVVVLSFICLGVQDVTSNDEMEAKIKELQESCMEKEGTSDDDVKKLRAGEYDKGGADKNVMCHVKCMLEGFEVLDGGKLKKETFIEQLNIMVDEEKAKETFEDCNVESGEDDCQTAFKIFTCVRKHVPEIF